MGRISGITTFDYQAPHGHYTATCYAYDTRSGFAHHCDFSWIGSATAYYYNRTWESYPYQSVLEQAVGTALEEENRLRRDWMDDRGYLRMTAKRRQELEADSLTSDFLEDLQAIQAQL